MSSPAKPQTGQVYVALLGIEIVQVRRPAVSGRVRLIVSADGPVGFDYAELVRGRVVSHDVPVGTGLLQDARTTRPVQKRVRLGLVLGRGSRPEVTAVPIEMVLELAVARKPAVPRRRRRSRAGL